MNKTMTIRRIAVSALLLSTTIILPRPAAAGRLGPDIIALFPKEVGEFGYADLKKARQEKWFPQLKEQMLPERFRQFEQFLASSGTDPNTQVEELAWRENRRVGIGEPSVVIAVGMGKPIRKAGGSSSSRQSTMRKA